MKFWLGVFASGCIVAFGLFGLDALEKNAAKEEAVRKTFMTKCIEFHSGHRCDEFWRYGRLDLAEPKGR